MNWYSILIIISLVGYLIFVGHHLSMALKVAHAAHEIAKNMTVAAAGWKKLAMDISAMEQSTTAIIATIEGYDVEVHHFNPDDERQARRLLTDMKTALVARESMKKKKDGKVEH